MEKTKLKQRRLEKEFSQEEMAKTISVTTSNYNRRENGAIKITKNEWDKLANKLECSKEEIFQENEFKKISIKYDSPIFNDNAIGVNNANFSDYTFETMKKYIAKLEEEIQNLKNQLSTQ